MNQLAFVLSRHVSRICEAVGVGGGLPAESGGVGRQEKALLERGEIQDVETPEAVSWP
jgi:hypothetical protein